MIRTSVDSETAFPSSGSVCSRPVLAGASVQAGSSRRPSSEGGRSTRSAGTSGGPSALWGGGGGGADRIAQSEDRGNRVGGRRGGGGGQVQRPLPGCAPPDRTRADRKVGLQRNLEGDGDAAAGAGNAAESPVHGVAELVRRRVEAAHIQP